MFKDPLTNFISVSIIGLILSATAAFAETTQEQEMGFKKKDPDTIIKETVEPDPSAPIPDPDVDPTAFKSKDQDSMISETHSPDPAAPIKDPDPELTDFRNKQHIELEPLNKTE